MAEQVNQRIENMINELEQMQRLNLFTVQEIREISKKRKEFEYKAQKRTKLKADYMNYIAYESTLLEDISLRRKKNGISEKKSDIEYTIAKRLNRMFKEFINRFQNDPEIYIQYIKFCKSIGFEQSISGIVGQLLQMFGERPKAWQLASKWECQEINDIDNARGFLLKGLHRHPESGILYQELFHLELYVAKQEEDQEKKENQLKRATVVWKNAISHIKNVRFHISLFKISNQFNEAESVTKELSDNLWDRHSEDTEVWIFLAEQELMGKHWEQMNQYTLLYDKLDEKLNNFICIYEAAIEKFKLEELCTKYVHTLLKLDSTDCNENDKVKIVKQALQYGHEHCVLSEDLYQFWISLLKLENALRNEEILKILESACEKKSKFKKLWMERLALNTDDESSMSKILLKAKKYLSNEDLSDLWIVVVDNIKTLPKLKKYYDECCKGPISYSSILKSKFLNLFHSLSGIKSARQLYLEMAKTPPLDLNLHKTMLDIEENEKSIDKKNCRKCYDIATQQFGKENIDLWLKYIKFESSIGDPKLVSSVYSRAVSNLNSNVVDNFIKQYTLKKLNNASI